MLTVKLSLPRDSFTLDVDLTLPTKGVTAFFGHSGSGKTSLLRCIAGLERAPIGEISFNNHVWQSDKTFTPTHKRQIGYVFQEASLFDHLTAQKNLSYAQKRASGKAELPLQQITELLGIDKLLSRYPAQLSGGERQRVAIARALLSNPAMLMMDEPLASLDYKRKQDILPYLETLKQELDLPILYVSHSAEEIARLADYIVYLDGGKVVADGTLSETLTQLDAPIQLGEETASVIQAKVQARDPDWQLTRITASCGTLRFRDMGHEIGQSVRVRILARDVSLTLEKQKNTSILNVLPAEVIGIHQESHAGLTLVKLRIGDDEILSRISSRSAHTLGLAPGKHIWAQIKSAAIVR